MEVFLGHFFTQGIPVWVFLTMWVIFLVVALFVLVRGADTFVVQITDNPEELLELYLLIKRVSEGIGCKEFGILMMEQASCRKAEGAFHLIAEMAFNFLSANIRFLGTIPMRTDFSRSILTQNPLLRGTEDSPAGLSIRRLADGLVRRAQLSERNHQ